MNGDRVSRPFPARYAGYCEHCPERIDEGDMIVYLGGHAVAHEDCVYDRDQFQASARVKLAAPCPTCHLTPCCCDA